MTKQRAGYLLSSQPHVKVASEWATACTPTGKIPSSEADKLPPLRQGPPYPTLKQYPRTREEVEAAALLAAAAAACCEGPSDATQS